MEEISRNSSTKNSQHKEKIKQTPSIKIEQLHHLMQRYLNKCNNKNIQNALPFIEKVKHDIENKQKQINLLKETQMGQNQLTKYYQKKNKLIQQLKQLGKKIQFTKGEIKKIKIKKQEIEEESRKNLQMLKQLQQKFKYQDINAKKLNKSICLPRISGFNFDLHHQSSRKRSTAYNIESLYTARSSEKQPIEEKDNFFNSLNFQRLKQIEKLLDQITIGIPIHKLEKVIAGNGRESIVKKVFKNFSIQEYFGNFFQDRKFYNLLFKIQNQ